MNLQAMAARISELCESVQHHADCYYNKAQSEITDAEFDALVDELKTLVAELERNNPSASEIDQGKEVLNNVGAVPSYGRKVKHSQIMGSLDKATKISEIVAWYKKNAPNGGKIAVMPKIDGCASRLNYDDGKLIQAATRGDGCLDAATLIEFEDGRRLPIGEVVSKRIHGRVKSLCVETGKIEYREITDFFNNGETVDWKDVVFEDESGNERTIRMTNNHQVWVTNSAGGRYVKASDLGVGDIVVGDLTQPSPLITVTGKRKFS